MDRVARLRQLTCVMAFLLVVAACANGEEVDQTTSEPDTDAETTVGAETTITFLGTGVAQFEAVFEEYEAMTPGVTIEAVDVPFEDIQNVITQRIGSGSSDVDIFMVDPTFIPIWVGRDYLYDLTSDFADSAQGVLGDSSTEGATFNGSMWTMPIWDSTQILWYNAEHLEAAGIEAPGTDPADRWTWDQLVDAAETSQSNGVRWGFQFEQADRYYQLQILPESLGGGPGVTGDDLLTPDITNEGWEQAVAFFASLYADGIAPPEATFDEVRALFEAGDLTFVITGPWNLKSLVENSDFQVGWAPHPYFDGGEPYTPSESWHWGINPKSDLIPEALGLLEFAGLTTEGAILADQRGLPSANIEAAAARLAELASFSEGTEGIDELALYEKANTAIRRPRTLGYQSLEELTVRMFGDLRTGADPQEALANTQAELEAVFSRIDPDNP